MLSAIPRRARSSGVRQWWVVVIGWVMRLSTPPGLGAIEDRRNLSANAALAR